MKFVVNDKEYESIPFDFELTCMFEERGFTMADLLINKNVLLLREYFCICSGLSKKEAMKEINEQIIKTGDMTSLADVMNAEMDKSDFIKAILAKMEEEETKTETEPQKQ